MTKEKYSKLECQMLLNYAESDDSELMEDKFEFISYMLHNESGYNFPLRSVSSIKNKYYKLTNDKRRKN